MCCGWKVIVQSFRNLKFGRQIWLISHFCVKYNVSQVENILGIFNYFLFWNITLFISYLWGVENINAMSQEMRCVTLWHHLWLDVTHTENCSPPLQARRSRDCNSWMKFNSYSSHNISRTTFSGGSIPEGYLLPRQTISPLIPLPLSTPGYISLFGKITSKTSRRPRASPRSESVV